MAESKATEASQPPATEQPPVTEQPPAAEQPPPYSTAQAPPYPTSTQMPQPGPVPQQPAAAPYPPGAYPPTAYPPGQQPATGAPYAAALGFMMPQLASNLPPQQVNWMPLPQQVPPGCPPGLEYLTQIDQILVHQQIEFFELVTGFETENKYRIRNTVGQQVYFAAERSSAFQRQCCGPGREFSMSIVDNTQREVIHLERPLRCYYNCGGLTCYCCCSCCIPNAIEVQSPPGTVIGHVTQEGLGIIRPWFSIQNTEGDVIMRIRGPILGCSCYSDANFDVLSADGTQSVGRISKQWSGLAKEIFTDADNFGIQFPMDLDVKMKAVMIAACFLIDFMFFEQPAGQGHHHHHHHRRH